MKLTLLGTGTPILETNRQASAVLVQPQNANLLFDTGRGVNTQLLRVGLSPSQIDAVFITHHHFDHIGDLGDVIIAAWQSNYSKPFTIFGPYGTQAIVNALLNYVYHREIEFTIRMRQQLGHQTPDIKDKFTVFDVEPGLIQHKSDYDVYADYVDHGSRFMAQSEWPCLGYRIESEGRIITISGDTIPCEGIQRLSQDADVLIQCCYLAEGEIDSPEREFLSNSVIASSGQVGKIAANAKVKKLILTHFRQKSEAMMQSILQDVAQDYAGEVILGEDLMQLED